MSDYTNFVSLALAGRVLTEEIDDYVSEWHERPDGRSLHDYLGMSEREYSLWLTAPDFLPLIIKSRKTGRPVERIAEDDLTSMRIAARSDDSLKVKRLQAWLNMRQVKR